MRINTYQGNVKHCTKLYKVLSMILFDGYHQDNKNNDGIRPVGFPTIIFFVTADSKDLIEIVLFHNYKSYI